jgi:uncharacterized membrane protein YqjE
VTELENLAPRPGLAMNDRPPDKPGIIGSIRRLADGLMATVQDRLELVAVELEEEKLRLIQVFIWINLAFFTGMLAVTFLSLTVVVLFWERARLAVVGGLATCYVIVCAAVVAALYRRITSQPRLFDATRQEIARDRTCIQPDL